MPRIEGKLISTLANRLTEWHSHVMQNTVDIAQDLQRRIDQIAARFDLSASNVIADALQNGHSLEWQEQFLDKVAAGLAAAERDDFASPDEITKVINRYRPR